MGRTLLPAAIRLYQRSRVVNAGLRFAVLVYHICTFWRIENLRPCPLAPNCSNAGLDEAMKLGWKALPVILHRMAVCGPQVAEMARKGGDCQSCNPLAGVDESTHCRPASGLDESTHCRPKSGLWQEQKTWCYGTPCESVSTMLLAGAAMPHPAPEDCCSKHYLSLGLFTRLWRLKLINFSPEDKCSGPGKQC